MKPAKKPAKAPAKAPAAATVKAKLVAKAKAGTRHPAGRTKNAMPPVKVTMKGTVLNLASRKQGVTLAEASHTLGNGEGAVRSLIGDLNRDGHPVRWHRATNTYHAE